MFAESSDTVFLFLFWACAVCIFYGSLNILFPIPPFSRRKSAYRFVQVACLPLSLLLFLSPGYDPEPENRQRALRQIENSEARTISDRKKETYQRKTGKKDFQNPQVLPVT